MTYAIGDVHGQNQKLCDLLNVIAPTSGDCLIFVGDYIDRGPDSAGVIHTLIELSDSTNCVFLRGNHEQMLLEARAHYEPGFGGVQGDSEMLFFANGGAETLISYTERFGDQTRWYLKIPMEHWEFLTATQFEHGIPGFKFVHAGYLPPGGKWEGQDSRHDPRLWIREPFLSSLADFGGIVVFGHTPQHSGRPMFMENKIGIDTAVAYGGPLTAIRIDGMNVEVVQV